MTRVLLASTLSGATLLAAALDAGLFGERDEPRLLIVANTAPIPELAAGFASSPAFAALRSRFDAVVDWNDLIAPLHPSHWRPPDAELPMLSRLVTERLGLTAGVTELVVESVADAPGAAVATLLRDCPVTVCSDDLTNYGPTRRTPHPAIGRRVTRLLHPEVVPGLTPLLLREFDVEPVVVPDSAIAGVLADVPVPGVAAGCPVIIGQELAADDVLTRDEAAELQRATLRALAARGERRVAVLPAVSTRALRDEADRQGVELVVADGDVPVEAWLAAARPSLVVSCCAPALFAARRHGLAAASHGTDVVLERLTPYENSLRAPVTLVASALPRLRADGTLSEPPSVDVRQLVEAVAYCMQADRSPDLRGAAVAYLAEHGPQRYFKKRRLETLGLLAPPPPAPPAPPPVPPTAPPKARRAARRLLSEARTAVDRRRGP